MNSFIATASFFFALCGTASHASQDLSDCQSPSGTCAGEVRNLSVEMQVALNSSNSVDAFGVSGGDTVLPTIIDTNSVARADWSEPDHVVISSAITQVVVTFSEAMSEDGLGSVLATENWLVVSSGANAAIETDGCGLVAGDDITLPIKAISYNYTSRTAVLKLDSAAGLQADTYRLLACSSLTDIAGLGLDGAGNGGDAEDYTRDFRITINPRAVNPNFDQGLLGWTLSSNPGQPWVQILEDGEGQPYSGASRLHSSVGISGDPWIEQCTSVPDAVGYSFSALARITSGAGGSRSLQMSIDWFDGAGCTGNILTTQYSNELVQSAQIFGELSISPAAAPVASQSARLRFEISTGGTSANFDLDRVRFPDMDLLLRSGFE